MYADIIIKGNAIFTGNESYPIKGAVVIKDDRILSVSKIENVSDYMGPHTRVIDSGDKLVLPGFHDFHLHLVLGSMFSEFTTLTECSSEEMAAQKMYQYAQENPNEPWILGFGWHHVRWPGKQTPTRHSLDQLISDRPVFLLNEEAHSAWVNSKALKLLNITSETEDPPFGLIERDKYGEPTGFLYETAVKLVAEKAYRFSEEKQRKLMDAFLKNTAFYGITSVSDMLPLPGFELGTPSFYATYEKKGKLTTRIHFLSALDGDLSKAKSYRELYQSDKLQFSGLKQFIDGVPNTYTGYLIEPYSDRPDTRGGILFEEETYMKWIKEADKEGFRIRLHACGDGAVRFGLDCYEAAQKQNGKRDSRHTIEHIEVIHPDDINRFEELQVIASIQPEHMSAESMEGHTYLDRLGPERSRYTWPIGSLKRSGAPIAFSSDYPVVDMNPMIEIYRAVTRRNADGTPNEGWNPQEKITLAEALQFYTKAPAYGNFRENDLGTLEVGKKADVAILDRNLFSVDVNEILDTKVAMTIMDGKIIYTREQTKKLEGAM
ncbi:amidohydrolase [Bacillus sp. JJ1521]|uniref:amidohydrolase n=1 Tax=Bacillus sp. JJ1521 TaxID=3122957 RepID=UPI002FFEA21E